MSFASAVAASRFELGDVLYQDARGYDDWSGTAPAGKTVIQVLDPPRSARGTALEGDADRRKANWESETRILLIDPASGDSVERAITQGHLLTAIWQGDTAWLEVDREAPPFPRTARALFSVLDASTHAWSADVARARPRSGSLFVMVVDLASDASRAKAALVGERLQMAGKVSVVDRTPSDAGIEHADLYHPTLILRGFISPGRDTETIESELRACLYRGGVAAIQETSAFEPTPQLESDSDAPVGGRFSVTRHGVLVGF